MKKIKDLKTEVNDFKDNIEFTENVGVVACTCNPATLEAEFRNGVGSVPVGRNSPSIGGWIV